MGEPVKDVFMQMAIVRIKKFQCDVLITLNTELENLKRPKTDVEMKEKTPKLNNEVDP